MVACSSCSATGLAMAQCFLNRRLGRRGFHFDTSQAANDVARRLTGDNLELGRRAGPSRFDAPFGLSQAGIDRLLGSEQSALAVGSSLSLRTVDERLGL